MYTADYEQRLRDNAEELGLEPKAVSLEFAINILQEAAQQILKAGLLTTLALKKEMKAGKRFTMKRNSPMLLTK